MTRLDAELVRRGLARSRRRAAELVDDGRVRVGGIPRSSPRTRWPRWTRWWSTSTASGSPAGRTSCSVPLPTSAALGTPLPVSGARCLDAGASTGGFTQVLLESGAAHVLAVDVGHGQVAPEVADDERVTVLEGVNVRDLRPGDRRRTAGGRGRRPVLHLPHTRARRPGPGDRARRRDARPGQASVRGGTRPARRGWGRARTRCGSRLCSTSRALCPTGSRYVPCCRAGCRGPPATARCSATWSTGPARAGAST